MKRRGQKVKLQHIDSGEEAEVVVVLSDSKMGYLGALSSEISPLVLNFLEEDQWWWYHPSEWREIK